MRKFLIFILCVAAMFYGWYRFSLRPVDASSTSRISLRIEPGSTTTQIAELLSRQGIIRSTFAFRLRSRARGADGKLQAGSFLLGPSLPIDAIIEALQNGRAQEIALTIPEGFTVTDIDALLRRKGLTATGAFVDCVRTCDLSAFGFLPPSSGLASRGGIVEGYLFPDTYFVDVEHFSVDDFLSRMLSTFRERVIDTSGEAVATSGHSLHEIMSMASLIEEEANTDAERPVIAGILWKRLEEHMGLGVDATVRYILQKPTGAITAGDLNVDSPYNTRKFRGLPPGPIASPGLSSIRAALLPRETTYWYYLHDRSGAIHYAETNDEHNENRMKYLKNR